MSRQRAGLIGVRSVMRTRTLPILLTVAGLAGLAGGCSTERGTPCGDAGGCAACAGLETGTADGAVLIVADGRSPALDSLVASDEDSEAMFRSPDLGLDTGPGLVLLQPVTPDGLGELQAFNLGGVGNGAHRDANAALQSNCLRRAVADLPEPQGGNLLVGVRDGVQLAENRAADHVGVVAIGVNRLTIRDFSVAGSDLSTPEARAFAIETLQSFDLVPTLSDRVAGVFFVAPDEGIDPLLAGGVRSFVADDLCAALAVPCSSGIEPAMQR